MLQRFMMIVVILVVLIGGGYYAYKQLVPPPEQEVTGPIYSTKAVTKGDISVGVEVTGPLNSNGGGIQVPGGHNYMETNPTSYIIDQFLIEAGDEVKQGDVLIKLAAPNLQVEIDNLEEQLLSEKKSLASLMNVDIEDVEYVNPDAGITLRAPIDGRIVNLTAVEGEKIEDGKTAAQVVDDSRIQIIAKLSKSEFDMITENHMGILEFPDVFSGSFEATIVDINPNPIPVSSSELGESSSTKAESYGYVYWVTLEAENPGLIRPGMTARIGFIDKADFNKNQDEKIDYSKVMWLGYNSKVEKFVNEKNVISSAEGIVTDIFVHKMEYVKANDPIIALSGQDVRKEIQDRLDNIRETKIKLQQAQSKLEMLEVKASIDGVVADIQSRVGDTVQPGQWLGFIFTTSDMRMWVQVDDMDVVLVKQGSPVEVTVDALPGKKFVGEVERVDTMGRDNNGITRYGVSIKFQGSAELRPSMQANAFINAGSAEDVLLIPLEAIFQEDGQNKVEILQTDGIPKVVPVELGLMDDRVAEVKSGLEEGQLVITGSTADLLPSQKIQSNTLLPAKQDNGNNNDGNGNDGQ